MYRPRVIPVLLLQNKGLVKTIKFKNPTYIGDYINAIRIFNEKKADELVILDIDASKDNRAISTNLISKLSDECHMPFAVGGGIRKLEDAISLIRSGAEKVVINTYAIENPEFIKEVSEHLGSQSVTVSVDFKKNLLGEYKIYNKFLKRTSKYNPVEFAKLMEKMGAGELFINSVDKDGTQKGYDIELVRKISDSVSIPVVACGGAGSLIDFREAIKKGNASAVAAGSFFVFHGKHRAVLISFPKLSNILSVLK